MTRDAITSAWIPINYELLQTPTKKQQHILPYKCNIVFFVFLNWGVLKQIVVKSPWKSVTGVLDRNELENQNMNTCINIQHAYIDTPMKNMRRERERERERERDIYIYIYREREGRILGGKGFEA